MEKMLYLFICVNGMSDNDSLCFVNFDEIKFLSSDAEGFDCSCGQGLLAQDGIQDIISMRLKLGC